MKLLPSLKSVTLVAIASLLVHPVSANPLDPFRGANRLIVMSLPDDASARNVAATLATQQEKIEERDLKVIDVSDGKQRLPKALRLPLEQTNSLRAQLKLAAGEKRSVFILIGKDGGEKARQLEKLNLEEWFALIDGMPMRRQEIRNKQASPR